MDPEVDLDGLVVDDTSGGRFRVHRSVFTAPEIFELERELIFARVWIYACHESEVSVPGSFISRRVAGKDVIITRGREPGGPFRVLSNVCTHRGAIVCREATGTAKVFTCPYHGWSFDHEGQLVGLPGGDAYDGCTAFDRKSLALRHLPRVDSYRGFVFVNLDPNAPSLVDYLAGSTEILDIIADQSPGGMELLPGSHNFTIRANWKLVAENGVDNYHVWYLHRGWVDFLRGIGANVDPKQTGRIKPAGRSLGNGHAMNEHEQYAAFGRIAGRYGPLLPKNVEPLLQANQRRLEAAYGADRAYVIGQANRNLRLFPNLYILDHSNTTIRTFYPSAVDRVEVTEWALAAKGEAPELREARIRLHSVIPGPASFASPDDMEVLERCQRGLSNGDMDWIDCSRGMKRQPLPTDELQHRGFFRHWHETITRHRVRHPHST